MLCRASNLPLDAVLAMPFREFLVWLRQIEPLRNIEFNALVSRVNNLVK